MYELSVQKMEPFVVVWESIVPSKSVMFKIGLRYVAVEMTDSG